MDQKYEFRAHRSEPKRTNGSAPSRPWRTPDCYAVVFQHVSPVQANLNDGYIGEPRGEAPADMLLAVLEALVKTFAARWLAPGDPP